MEQDDCHKNLVRKIAAERYWRVFEIFFIHNYLSMKKL